MASTGLGSSDSRASVAHPLAGRSFWFLLSLILVALSVGIVAAFVHVRISPFLALLAILALPLGLLFISRPNIGLLVVVFLIPFEIFNTIPGMPDASLSAMKLISFAAFAGAGIHFLVFRKSDRLVSAPQNWLILLFLGAAVISYFFAINPANTLSKDLKLVRVLLLYLVTINVVRTRTDLRHVLWTMIVAGLLCALYGIFTYHFNPSVLGSDRRISGTMDHPNGFAAAMVALVPLVLSLLMSERHIGLRVLLALTAPVLVYGILLSGSRGGMVALVFALGLHIFRQRHRLVVLAVFLMLALLLLAVAPPEVKERFSLAPERYPTADFSIERRLTYQKLGLELLQEHPLTGIGLHGFPDAYARSQYRFLQSDDVKRVAHNMYLEIATGTGLLGLIPFMALLLVSLYGVLRVAQQMDNRGFLASVANGIFAGLGGFLVASLFLSEQYEKTLWLLIALTVVVQLVPSTTPPQRRVGQLPADSTTGNLA